MEVWVVIIIVIAVLLAALMLVGMLSFMKSKREALAPYGSPPSFGGNFNSSYYWGGDDEEDYLGGAKKMPEGESSDGNPMGPKPLGLSMRDPGLYNVQTGKATVLARLGDMSKADSYFAKWKVGEIVNLFNSVRRFPVEVKAMRQYKSFADFAKAESPKKMGLSSEAEVRKALEEVGITDDKIASSGLVAIEVSVDAKNQGPPPGMRGHQN